MITQQQRHLLDGRVRREWDVGKGAILDDQGAPFGAALDLVAGRDGDGVLDPGTLTEEVRPVDLVESIEQQRRILRQPSG
jgi:hypothetical protein